MSPYRGADAPVERPKPHKLWLRPKSRAFVFVLACALVVFATAIAAFARVESPIALISSFPALMVAWLFQASFASIVIDGDAVDCRRGLVGQRIHHLSVANGCTVQVVGASSPNLGPGRKPNGLVFLVELATPEGSWVLAEEADRDAAAAIADWVRAHLPPARLRVAEAVRSAERLRLAGTEGEPEAEDEPEVRSQRRG